MAIGEGGLVGLVGLGDPRERSWRRECLTGREGARRSVWAQWNGCNEHMRVRYGKMQSEGNIPLS